jgi:hypothetical protein
MTSYNAATTAADFDTFVIQAGNWGGAGSLTTNVATDTDRIALTSNVTSIAVNNGEVTGGPSFTIDDGFVAGIVVQALANVNADAVFGTLILDADGGLTGATRSGGLPGGISAEGSLTIGTLDTDAENEADPAAVTNVPANDVAFLRAGQSITVTGVLDIGGGLFETLITNASGTANDGDPHPDITIALLQVNGNVDLIATAGNADENITIVSAASFIGGDLDNIDAGLGTVDISGLRVVQGTTASPVFVVTSEGVNFFLDIIGSDAGAAVVDYSLVVDPGPEAFLTINDIDGLVNNSSVGNFADDTEIALATRLDNGTAGATTSTSADNSTAQFHRRETGPTGAG